MSINANVAVKLPLKDQHTQSGPLSNNDAELQSLTKNETAVFKELQQADGPQKAYALLEALSEKGVRAPMTVYRALDGLIAKGFAKKITSQNAYILVNPETQSAVVAYVTCKRCGKTHEVSLEKSIIATMLASINLRLQEIFIEAYGECEDIKHCS